MLLDKESGGFQAFDFGLDRRLIKAVARLGYVYPTLVQGKAIPLALEGKDLLVRARTGSGKTAAFALPTLHKVLLHKEQQLAAPAPEQQPVSAAGPAARTRRARAAAATASSSSTNAKAGGVLAVILVPTKELCDQTYRTFFDLSYYCRDLINVQALMGDNLAAQQALLRDEPDVLIATPSRLLAHLQAGNITLRESVQTLVMDEADLILSFGYDEDVKAVVAQLPRIYQGMLMSATLSPELDDLKRVVLHSPTILKLEEGETDGELLQFFVTLPEEDKYLLLFVFLKLGVLEGKGLFFVNSLDACYRLKLFLEQFSIRAAVLNAELPLNSRIHTIQEYNRGVFDYLIATDESMDTACGVGAGGKKRRRSDSDSGSESESEGEEEEEQVEEEQEGKGKGKKGKGKGKAAENEDEKDYGVHRGIDFQAVSFVVNVDLPRSARAYTHRVGRTARGGANGTALSLVAKDDARQAATLAEVQASQPALPPLDGDTSLEALPAGGDGVGMGLHARAQPAPLAFDLRELEGFRYRVEDVKRAVTKVAVKEARLAEIKQELLNSEVLKGHFQENPHEFQILRHDKGLLPSHRVQEHLKHVPDYLLPEGMRVGKDPSAKKKKRRRAGKKRALGQGTDRQRRKDNDPLQSFGGADGQGAAAAVAVAGEHDVDGGGMHDVEEDEGGFEDEYESGGEEEGGGGGPGEDRIYQSTDGLGQSTAGRVKWKMAHKKGKWNRFGGKKPEKKKFTRH